MSVESIDVEREKLKTKTNYNISDLSIINLASDLQNNAISAINIIIL